MSGSNLAIAFFDFDGTITTKDTLFEIIKYIHGKWRLYVGLLLLSPSLILFILHVIPKLKAKEGLFKYFFGGMTEKEFQQQCNQFAIDVLPRLIRVDAMDTINQLQEKGIRIVVVTASLENWVGVWSRLHRAECIGTRMEVEDGRLTGKIAGANCHGEEKVNRIKESYELNDFSEIYAYGDSRGDLPMLNLATKPHYKLFKD